MFQWGEYLFAFDFAEKKCECGIFDTKTPIKSQKPIINPSFAADTCDRVITCIRFCYTILNGMGGRILDLLCAVVGHCTNLVVKNDFENMWTIVIPNWYLLQPHVHTRVCGADRWFFAGTILDKGICCQDSKFIDCRSQTENTFLPDDPLAWSL